MPLLSTSSGSLYCGVYQFSYRLVRQIRYADGVYDEVYSDWTLPTAPVYIFDKLDSVSAGDGRPFRQTDNRIVLTINPTAEEKAFYTHYEVAVLRRLDEAYAPPTEAFKYDAVPFPTTWPSRFEVNSNYEFNQIDPADILVDKAPIASVKTLATKNSVLFAGNVRYVDMSINPTINKNGCETIKKDIGFPYKGTSTNKGYTDAMNAHKYVGHFRDEVYRYAVTYVDKYGNWSAPKVLNFSGATNNKAVDGIDWKFPSRSEQNFTLFNGSGNLEAIGLKISNLNNHPSWAVGFSIVRAKRRKNILFQTPLVNTQHIQPPRIPPRYTSLYPQADVQVADYVGTLVPKSFYFPLNRHIKVNTSSGECWWVTGSDSDPENKVFMVFPPEMMYRSSQGITVDAYTEGQTQVLNIIDAVGLKMNKTNFDANTGPPAAGDTRFTNTTATFFATEAWQYYYERGYAKTALSSIAPFTGKDYKITEFGMIENAQSKYTLRSTVDGLVAPSFGDYEGIQDSQATDVAPTNVRGAIVILNSHIPDPSHYSFVTETAPVKDDISFDLTNSAKRIANSLISSQSDQTFHSDESNIISAVFVANVLAGLSDARYGDETEYNEFIPTHFEVGGKMSSAYMFSSTERATVAAGASLPININVWGGDCFITRHNFKVSTSQFHIAFATTSDNAKDWWGVEYDCVDVSNTNFDRPVALDGASQILQLFLESEVNSDVAERDAVTKGGASYELMEGGAYEIPTPLNYFYMPAYSVPNGLKLFTSAGVLQRNSNVFPSRITFSNVKLLNTSLDGFELFNVADYYDLNGELGDITKLITLQGRMYGIQERGFAYIPIEAGIIESEDAGMLSVSSGRMINIPQYISSNYGCNHIKSVISADNAIVFADVNNKTIIKFSNDGVSPIGDIAVNSYFNSAFAGSISESDLYTFYDFNEKQLYIVRSYSNNGGFAILYNDHLGVWETPLQISQTNNIKGLSYFDGSVYGFGISSAANLEIHRLYSNSNSTWFGTNIVPFVKYVVNPNPTISSTFDLVVVDSSEKLATVSMNVERDNESIDASTGDISIDIDPRKGVYKVNELRNIINVGDYTTRTLDSIAADRALRSGQRMKGTYAVCTIKWPTLSSIPRILTSVVTKFRPTRGAI